MTSLPRIGDSKVLESRETDDGTTIRRRRVGADGRRFTTYERVELPQLTVVKRSGNRELFDRDKLISSVRRSVGKFMGSELEVESVADKVVGLLRAENDDVITSQQVGDAVLDVLAEHNEVAYVRFASVFLKFQTLDDFEKILQERRLKHSEKSSERSSEKSSEGSSEKSSERSSEGSSEKSSERSSERSSEKSSERVQ